MKILAINGAWRKDGATTELVKEALSGAEATGADCEMVMLADADIRPCTNCLACYRDQTSDLGPCSIRDDMSGIIEKVVQADGVILASPMHSAFVSGMMVNFFERLVWRMCVPTRRMAGFRNCPYPRTAKTRAACAIMTAGGMPDKVGRFLPAIPWLKSNAIDCLNAHWVGDYFGGSHLTRLPESEEDFKNVYFMREISQSQLRACRELGAKMAGVIAAGSMKPTSPMNPLMSAVMKLYCGFGGFYRTTD